MTALVLVAFGGLLLFALAGALHRDRRDREDRAFGQVIARRYQSDDVPHATGRIGEGRTSRGRSAPRAYTASL